MGDQAIFGEDDVAVLCRKKGITMLLPEFLTKHDAFWRWNGHKHVAKLTSGKLSDFYVNCTPVFTDPHVQAELAEELVALVADDLNGFAAQGSNIWVVGSAMGAIGLAQSIASSEGFLAAYTEPFEEQPDEDDILSGNNVSRKTMKLKRFDLGHNPLVILCEDVVTTGGTTVKTIDGILDKHPGARFFSKILTLVNQNPDVVIHDREHLEVKALYEHAAKVWVEGEGPPEMNHCVPVRPKDNWKVLTTEML